MKETTAQRVDRVKEEMEAGASYTEIVEKLSNEFDIAARSMDSIITMANSELRAERKLRKEITEEIRAEQLKKAATGIMMSVQEAGAYLSQIIRGERQEYRLVVTSIGSENVAVPTRTSDVLKAVNIYLKYADLFLKGGLQDDMPPEELKQMASAHAPLPGYICMEVDKKHYEERTHTLSKAGSTPEEIERLLGKPDPRWYENTEGGHESTPIENDAVHADTRVHEKEDTGVTKEKSGYDSDMYDTPLQNDLQHAVTRGNMNPKAPVKRRLAVKAYPINNNYGSYTQYLRSKGIGR